MRCKITDQDVKKRGYVRWPHTWTHTCFIRSVVVDAAVLRLPSGSGRREESYPGMRLVQGTLEGV